VLAVDNDVVSEQILRGCSVQEVVLRLFDNVVQIDKEQEISVSLLIQVGDESSHDERLATSGCHVEKYLQRIRTLLALKIGDEVAKGILLIGA
jgi:hypothetical protein